MSGRFGTTGSPKQRVGRPAGAWQIGPFAVPRKEGAGVPKVYFVRCCEFVKIGTSNDVPSRLAHLQTASPFVLTLIASVKGGAIEEGVWHGRFAAARTQGEWFRLTDEQILSAIEEFRKADAEAYRRNTVLRRKNAARMQLSRMAEKSTTPLPTPKTREELHALIKAEAARPVPRSSMLDCIAQHIVLLDETDGPAKKLVKFLQVAAKARAQKKATKRAKKREEVQEVIHSPIGQRLKEVGIQRAVAEHYRLQ